MDLETLREHVPKALAAGATSMTVHKACQGFKIVVQEVRAFTAVSFESQV
jgi:hypothetical protein